MLIGTKVELCDVLSARDNRAGKQVELIAKYNLPIICFTMNIAGSVKNNLLIELAFKEGCQMLQDGLDRNNVKIVQQEILSLNTGCEGYFVIDCTPHTIKKLTTYIEDNEDMCRLFDIDVLDTNGVKIAREEIGADSRKCFLCDNYSKNCSRSRTHSLEELSDWTQSTIKNYFENNFADKISSLAIKSLMYEVCITPKPGLVDRDNSGSHRDMDIFTFVDSATSLAPYFKNCVLKGIKFADISPSELLEKIRFEGIKAESQMLKSTKSVNTHKGAIFSLGILCCAIGYYFNINSTIDINEVLNLCSQITKDIVSKDFDGITEENASTFGQKLFVKTGDKGIRGEVSSGMPSVKNIGLPIFTKCMRAGKSINESGAIALYHLIANVTDTNIISRSNLETQQAVKEKARLYLKENPIPSTDYLKEIDQEFIKINISPGGCADLLAITIMLYYLDNEIY